MTALDTFLAEVAERTNGALDRLLPREDEEPRDLHRAMRYSVFAGGKRVRPVLAVLGARAAGGPEEKAIPVACAYECVHTYSLIHDDLPALDNDDLRRGRPTSHKVFGEAMAILAGDALLTFAFEALHAPSVYSGSVAGRLALELAQAAGPRGMVGGQVLDIEAERGKRTKDAALLDRIHRWKTAALIRGAVRSGALATAPAPGDPGYPDERRERVIDALGRYGEAVGLAFQVADDILDVTSTAAELGKTPGKDVAQGKLTYPAVHGLDTARREAHRLADEATAALAGLGREADLLRDLARFVVTRGK